MDVNLIANNNNCTMTSLFFSLVPLRASFVRFLSLLGMKNRNEAKMQQQRLKRFSSLEMCVTHVLHVHGTKSMLRYENV